MHSDPWMAVVEAFEWLAVISWCERTTTSAKKKTCNRKGISRRYFD